jgi:hypothetical protein
MRRTKIGTLRAGLTAVALAVMSTVLSVAPAQAAAAGKDCYVIDGQVICVPLAVNWLWWLDCPQCGRFVRHSEDPVIRQDLAELVNQYLSQGLGDLSAATLTTDPTRKAALRNAALDKFVSAARSASGSRVFVGWAGRIDPATGRLGPEPEPWLWESGVDEADGIAWLQRSFADPANAARYRSLAMAQFDEAYTEIANKQVIVG